MAAAWLSVGTSGLGLDITTVPSLQTMQHGWLERRYNLRGCDSAVGGCRAPKRDEKNYTSHNLSRALFAAVACGQSGEAAVAGAEEGHFKRAGDCRRQWPWRIQRLQHRRRRLAQLMLQPMRLLFSWENPASSR